MIRIRTYLRTLPLITFMLIATFFYSLAVVAEDSKKLEEDNVEVEFILKQSNKPEKSELLSENKHDHSEYWILTLSFNSPNLSKEHVTTSRNLVGHPILNCQLKLDIVLG